MQEPLPRRFAPEIFRKRMLIEGYFGRRGLDAEAIREYFRAITSRLGLRTYGEPIVASVILYTCAEFDTADAAEATRAFFELTEWETALF